MNDLTQRDVGEELGVHHSMVSRWESGAVSPTVDQFLQLCALLELDPGNVLTRVAA